MDSAAANLTDITFNDIEKPEILPDHIKLKNYLDTRGIRYNWLTEQLGYTRTWCTDLFNGMMK
jgi:hypothetical protein